VSGPAAFSTTNIACGTSDAFSTTSASKVTGDLRLFQQMARMHFVKHTWQEQERHATTTITTTNTKTAKCDAISARDAICLVIVRYVYDIREAIRPPRFSHQVGSSNFSERSPSTYSTHPETWSTPLACNLASVVDSCLKR
jgi:hypothetical protein